MKLKIGSPVRMIAQVSDYQDAVEVRMTVVEIKGNLAICEWEEEVPPPEGKKGQYFQQCRKEFPLNKLIPVEDYGRA